MKFRTMNHFQNATLLCALKLQPLDQLMSQLQCPVMMSQLLFQRLKQYEAAGRPYHLIGHSHGGSVIAGYVDGLLTNRQIIGTCMGDGDDNGSKNASNE